MLRSLGKRSVLALVAASCWLLPAPVSAQNGSNFQIFSNGLDLIYAGVGAGGGQVAGIDGLGTWLDGEELKGTSLTSLGSFGYRQTGWTETPCVLGAPGPGLAIEFPLITLAELDGRNPHQPDVFTYPVCGTAGPFPLGNSFGFVPFGAPPGSSASFALVGLPSGLGLPTSAVQLLPNHGLLPTSNGGTATLVGALSTALPIASTGFCWTVSFGWAPSALPAQQDMDGWWHWTTNSTQGNQYWGLSTNELNLWQSRSAVLDQGGAALLQFFANVDYVYHAQSANPVTQEALAPAAAVGSGSFYTTGAGCPLSGSSLNGGFDMGRHVGVSLSGTGGVPNPASGLGNQDPAGAALPGLAPTLGFVTSNNRAYAGGAGGWRATWVQLDLDLSFGIDPAAGSSVPLFLGAVRLPICVPATPGPFPQPLTTLLLPLFVHDTQPLVAAPGCWDLPAGALGPGGGLVAGASTHLPLSSSGAACLGVPVGLSFGSSGLAGPSGPLVWDPSQAEVSLGRQLLLID